MTQLNQPARAGRIHAPTSNARYTKTEPEANLKFLHRKLAQGDLYFVDNRGDHAAKVEATFRVEGKVPQLWYAETGKIKPVSFTVADGRTTVPLNLEAWGTVFVVFRKPTTETSWAAQVEKQLLAVHGPWKVSFPPNWGAPSSITLDSLSSWSRNADPGVKYFSGTGTYTKVINIPASWFHHKARLWLNLGDVKNLAQVSVNGKTLRVVWHAPYRVDVTSALHSGANELSIKVTNAWVDRLIGDQQPDATKKYTFTDVKPYRANSPLLASGLLGPVTLNSVVIR